MVIRHITLSNLALGRDSLYGLDSLDEGAVGNLRRAHAHVALDLGDLLQLLAQLR